MFFKRTLQHAPKAGRNVLQQSLTAMMKPHGQDMQHKKVAIKGTAGTS